MEKKLLTILLSFTMAASLLTGCGTPSASETAKESAASIPETETAQAPPEMPTASTVEIPSAEETSNVEGTDGEETGGFTWGNILPSFP